MNNSSDDFSKELEDFINSPEAPAPEALSQPLRKSIHKELNPHLSVVLLKVFTIQLFAGASTLSMCTQFGVGFFDYEGLRSIFILFGEIGCMALCGGFFIGAGALATMYLLRPEEIRVIWKQKEIYYSLFSLLFLLGFYVLGTEHMHLSMFVAWFLGSFVSAELILSAVKKIRFKDWNPTLHGSV